MKKLCLIFAMFAFAAPSFSQDNSFVNSEAVEGDELLTYEVTPTYDAESSELRIAFTSRAIHSSMCGLATNRVKVKAPKGELLHPTPVGQISFSTRLLPRTICLMAFGPHRGALTLKVGPDALESGSYALTINGEKYGFLQLTEDGEVTLVPTINVLF